MITILGHAEITTIGAPQIQKITSGVKPKRPARPPAALPPSTPLQLKTLARVAVVVSPHATHVVEFRRVDLARRVEHRIGHMRALDQAENHVGRARAFADLHDRVQGALKRHPRSGHP